MAYDNNQMKWTRRSAAVALLGSVCLGLRGQSPDFPQDQNERRLPLPSIGNEDKRLPNGKSQNIAMAKAQHEQALKEAKTLVELAQGLRDELEKAGDYTVPVSSVRKTEQIEKLAKRIRGRLQF